MQYISVQVNDPDTGPYIDEVEGSIYALDLATGSEKKLVERGEKPVVRDGVLVWSQTITDTSGMSALELHMLKLDGSQGDTVISPPVQEGFTEYEVSGDNVVWSSWPGADAKVHLYSISKGSTTIISGPDAGYPQISGDKVAWVVEPNGGMTGGAMVNWQVQEYDLRLGTTTTLFNLDAADFGLDALLQHSGRLALAYRVGSPYRTLYVADLGAAR